MNLLLACLVKMLTSDEYLTLLVDAIGLTAIFLIMPALGNLWGFFCLLVEDFVAPN